MKQVDPTYLGDAIYASWDGELIAIHTGSHDSFPAKVFFERENLLNLIRYALKCELILSNQLDAMGDQ